MRVAIYLLGISFAMGASNTFCGENPSVPQERSHIRMKCTFIDRGANFIRFGEMTSGGATWTSPDNFTAMVGEIYAGAHGPAVYQFVIYKHAGNVNFQAESYVRRDRFDTCVETEIWTTETENVSFLCSPLGAEPCWKRSIN